VAKGVEVTRAEMELSNGRRCMPSRNGVRIRARGGRRRSFSGPGHGKSGSTEPGAIGFRGSGRDDLLALDSPEGSGDGRRAAFGLELDDFLVGGERSGDRALRESASAGELGAVHGERELRFDAYGKRWLSERVGRGEGDGGCDERGAFGIGGSRPDDRVPADDSDSLGGRDR